MLTEKLYLHVADPSFNCTKREYSSPAGENDISSSVSACCTSYFTYVAEEKAALKL